MTFLIIGQRVVETAVLAWALFYIVVVGRTLLRQDAS